MSYKKRSLPPWFGRAFVVVAVLAAAILNSLAAKDGIVGNTISAFVTHGAAALPYALGVLVGHFMSARMSFPSMGASGFVVALVTVALVAVVDAWTEGDLGHTYPFWVWFFTGLPVGAVLWPLSDTPG